MTVDVSRIGNTTLAGRIMRLPLRLLPAGMVVPILQGPARGLKWRVGASTHGCWLGTYELACQLAFAQAVRPGAVVFDVGAHVGFYTLVAAAAVGRTGRVVAFEPVDRNLHHLQRHVQLNRLDHVTVIRSAVADQPGEGTFARHPDPSMGRLSPVGRDRVRVTTLDEVTATGAVPDPAVIKIDVEGAEHRVLAGGRSTILRARPVIFIATHGDEVRRACIDWLESAGYTVGRPAADELIASWPHGAGATGAAPAPGPPS